MSGLTKKQIYVDRNLSAIFKVSEGELVSYAEIQKLLHKYIKDNDLKNLQRARPSPSMSRTLPEVAEQKRATLVSSGMKNCRDCGSRIPSEAVFCDQCGVTQ
jgi:ribosomal protein L40E